MTSLTTKTPNRRPLPPVLVACVWALVGWPAAARATDGVITSRRSETSGPALSVGIGNDYGLAGAQLGYYFRLPTVPISLVPHFGGGMGIVPDDKARPQAPPGVTVGLTGVFGSRHRIVADAAYGTLAAESLYLHTSWVATHNTYGLMANFGYEFVSEGGFLFRAQAGYGYPLQTNLPASERRPIPTVSIGLGWKLR